LFNKNQILIVDRIVSIIVGITTMAIITRLIGLDDFGLWVATMSFVGFFSIFTTLGFESVLVKIIAVSGNGRAEVCRGIVSRLAGAVIGLTLLLLAFWALSAPIEIYWAFPLLFSRIFLSVNSLDQFYQAKNDFSTGAKIRIESNILLIIYLGLGLFLYQSIYVIISAYILQAIYGMIRYLKLGYANGFFNYSIFKELINVKLYKNFLHKVAPLFITGILIVATLHFDKIIGSYYFSLIELGLYGLAFSISQALLAVMGAVNNLYYNQIIIHKKYFSLRNYTQVFVVIFFSILGIYYIFFIFGDYIISLIFGDGFERSLEVLKILLIGLLPTLLTQVNDAYLVAHNSQKFIMYRTLGYLLILVALSPFFIDSFGYTGMAVLIVLLKYFAFFYGFSKLANFKRSL
jgi:O-antigen/teichoic acid export membrane protein